MNFSSKIRTMIHKKSHMVALGVLSLLLVITLLNVQTQQQVEQTAAEISPTYVCAGGINCVPSLSLAPTLDETNPIAPSEPDPQTSADPSDDAVPTTDPCIQSVSSAEQRVAHVKSQTGGIGNFMKAILEFFIQLINLLLQLIGGGDISLPPSSPSPTEVPDDNTPEPTSNPCPTMAEEPTQAAAPSLSNPSPTIFGTTGVPTVAPSTAPAANLQPAVNFAKPAGGQWNLRWHDEFDGSGGTTADAMSGVNFKDKTVGGGALAGNPGLNPKKWNMGWQTGPDTVDGLGMVTTATTGMCPNGCTENDWYGVDALIFPGDGALHMRSQEKQGTAPNPERGTTSSSKNLMGMITTAGLLAFNPGKTSHGNVPADRFVDGPMILEWKATNTYVVDWPAFWMANAGYFGHAGKDWPGGTAFQEEIDLVEPIFRMHVASEFQSGKNPIPDEFDKNETLTFTWFFDTNRLVLWVTDESGKQVKQIDIPDGEVSADMIEAQWKLPQYLFIQQKNLQETAGYGDMTLEYVRIWN